MKSTIKDVAKHADVSIATVSRVMNGADNVNPALKEKVLNSIKELSYTPNQLARGLKSNVTKTIGVIIADIANPFFMKIMRQIETIIGGHGYTMLIVSTDDNAEKESKYINIMINKGVDGIVISPTGENEDLLYLVQKKGIPVVLISRRPNRLYFDTVYVDKADGTKKLNKYLFDKGHKKIALITGPKEFSSNKDRLRGYIESYFQENIQTDNTLIMNGEFTYEFGLASMKKIVDNKMDITAIIAGSPQITTGIYTQTKRMGVRIPEDISIVTYGDILNAELIEPRLTYINAMEEEIGREAGKLILQRIDNFDEKPKEVIFESIIIEGKSVKNIKKY